MSCKACCCTPLPPAPSSLGSSSGRASQGCSYGQEQVQGRRQCVTIVVSSAQCSCMTPSQAFFLHVTKPVYARVVFILHPRPHLATSWNHSQLRLLCLFQQHQQPLCCQHCLLRSNGHVHQDFCCCLAAQYCQSRTTCNAPVLENSGMRVACRSVYRRTCCGSSKLSYFASFESPVDGLGSLLLMVSAIPKLPPTAATLLPARQHASQMCKTCSPKLREEAQIVNLEYHIPASAPCATSRDDMMVRKVLNWRLLRHVRMHLECNKLSSLLAFVHSVRYTLRSIASTPVPRSPWLLQ